MLKATRLRFSSFSLLRPGPTPTHGSDSHLTGGSTEATRPEERASFHAPWSGTPPSDQHLPCTAVAGERSLLHGTQLEVALWLAGSSVTGRRNRLHDTSEQV